MDKNIHEWWKEVKAGVSDYLQARAQLTRLQAYEKIAKVIGVLFSFVIIAFVGGLLILFLLIMIGAWVSELTHSIGIGFTTIAFLMVCLFILFLMKRKSLLEKPVSNQAIKALFDEDDDYHSPNDKSSNGD